MLPLVTDREYEILRSLLEGMETKDIAEHLRLSGKIVNNEIYELCRKYGVRNRVQLAVRVWTIGLEKIGKSA